jgi:hypothetical protein
MSTDDFYDYLQKIKNSHRHLKEEILNKLENDKNKNVNTNINKLNVNIDNVIIFCFIKLE